MFKPVKGGSTYTIYDAFGVPIVCNLPPIGYGVNPDTGELAKTDIIKRSSKKEEQHWQRESYPDWYAKKREAEELEQELDPEYVDDDCERFRESHWRRRLYGCWFWNNGVLTYITGLHWFTLSWWKFQGKYFDFRIPNMEYYYFIDYIISDPNCLGGIEITKRKEGKCFGKDTMIRMYDGSVKAVQDIKNGELLMGNDSKERLVYGVTSGNEQMYKITPKKGKSFAVNGSHIIYAWDWTGNGKRGYRKQVPIKFKATDFFTFGKGKKKRMLIERSGWGDEFEANHHIVDPYMLGVWLGDGASKGLQITNQDKEVTDYIKDFAVRHKLSYNNFGQISKSANVHIQHGLGQKDVNVIEYMENGEWTEYPSKQALMRYLGKHVKTPIKTLGLFKQGRVKIKEQLTNEPWNEFKRMDLPSNKHIPKEYLIDSRENRLQLLAGLLDTDGHLSKVEGRPCGYSLTFSNKYKKLINDSVTLIRSLGLACHVRQDSCSDATELNIFGKIEIVPCKIERKKAISVKRKYDSLKCSFSIESIGEGEYFGFAVDDNHLFLLEDGTVVHNTARAGSFLYEYTSRTPAKHGGIQSKTDGDANEVFKKAVVDPFRHLPHWFRPIFDTAAGSDPKKELRFFAPSRKGRKKKSEINTMDALESFIDFKSSGVIAYDGPELHRYVSDESGKLENISIMDRHDVVKFCSEVDGAFVGKQLYTTTVEAQESGGSEFFKLVKQSDRRELTENGRTKSGLYCYFLPAYRTLFYDKYGFPDEDKGRTYFMNTRTSLVAEPRSLSSFIRKNPFTLAESFRVDGEKSLFNPERLNEQLEWLNWHPEIIQKGNFEWKNNERLTEVIWVPTVNGRWQMPTAFNIAKSNEVEFRNGRYYPKNTHSYRGGADPFRFDKAKDKRRSDCAAFIAKTLDPINPSYPFNNAFVCRYRYRAATTAMSNEDLLKMCWFFGCPILIERNVNHWCSFFIENNCQGFLIKLDGEEEFGIYSDGQGGMLQAIADLLESYIEHDSKKLLFKELVSEYLEFDIGNTTAYDETIASGITLVALKKSYRKIKNDGSNDISRYFKRYKVNQ